MIGVIRKTADVMIGLLIKSQSLHANAKTVYTLMKNRSRVKENEHVEDALQIERNELVIWWMNVH